MTGKRNYTHRVAVNAYLVYRDKFLLLKRTREPHLWGPPGGRLEVDEDPIAGLHREVKEETNLEIRVVAPVNTWFGLWKESYYLLSIDFLAEVTGGRIQLSDEHSDYMWVGIEELIAGKPIRLDSPKGFQVKDFQLAYRVGRCFDVFTV